MRNMSFQDIAGGEPVRVQGMGCIERGDVHEPNFNRYLNKNPDTNKIIRTTE